MLQDEIRHAAKMNEPMDAFSQYEAGLEQLLRRLGKDHPRHLEALTYQSRLLENIRNARRYSDTQDYRSERNRILEGLNQLALDALGTSFNELCIASVEGITASSWEPTVGLDQMASQSSRMLVGRSDRVEAILTDHLKQAVGILGSGSTPSLELPRPDSVPFPPKIYAPRDDLVRKLCDDLTNVVWLALVDGPGKGKTQLARAIAQASGARCVWWISLRGHEDKTANLHFEQQMARWLVELNIDEHLRDLYASGWLSLGKLADLVSECVGSHGILVVDNLPDSLKDEALFRNLETVATGFTPNGTKLLTTSQHELPPLLRMDRGIVSVVGLPPFSVHDISQMLNSAGAPVKVREDGISSLILGVTSGHPTLVAATVHWLKGHQWQIRNQELDALLRGDPAEEVREYERRRILRLLGEPPKRLLYRLSMLWGDFDEALALAIAAVSPAVQYPGECLDDLIGPWVDRVGENQFAVTPLLTGAGRQNLPEDEQEKIHRTVTQYYFDKNVINVSQAHVVASHLWAAGEYRTFAAFVTRLMLSAETPTQARHVEWATLVLSPDMQWPSELALDQRIMLRAAQVRTRALVGRDITELDADLKRLIAEAGPDDSDALVLAYLSTGPFLLNGVPAQVSLPRAIEAVRLLRAKPLIPEERLHGKFEDIIWFSVARLKGSEQVCQFLQEIRQMTEEEQQRLFESDLAAEATSHLIDSVWSVEADKPNEQQDWGSILKVLDEVRDIASISGAVALQVAQVRAKAVVLADYLKQVEDALSVLDEGPDTADPSLSFLLEYTTGCVLFDAEQFEDAHVHLDLAVGAPGDSFSYYRLDAKRRAAIIKSRMGEWSEAKRRCIEVVQLMQRVGESLIYDQLEMMGELAWVHWASGDRKKACAAIHGLVTGLVNRGNVTARRFREVFNKAGHSLGWFGAMAATGQPPPRTITGELYTSVEAGLFGIRRERLGDYVPPVGFSKALLLTQLGMLAAASDLPRLAWKTYIRASSLVAAGDSSALLEISKVEFAPLAVQFGHPHEAVSLGLEAARALAVSERLHESGIDMLDPSVDIQGIWRSIPCEERRSRQRLLLYWVLGPAFSDLLGSEVPEDEARGRLKAWEHALSMNQEVLEEPEFWEQVIQFLQKLWSVWVGESPLEEDLRIPGEPLLEVFWHLVRSSQGQTSLLESLQIQLSVINVLLVPSGMGKYVLPGVGSFVHRYWLNIATTRGFALNSPHLFREDLFRISPRKGAKTAVQVLRSASRAVGASLPDEILEKFQQAEGSKTR